MPLRSTADAPAALLPFLFARHPEVKKTKVRQWLKFGSVKVNGKTSRQHDHALVSGDEVVIEMERSKRAAPSLPAGMTIVHEDESMIVIDKPADMLSIATETERTQTAYAHLTRHVRRGNPRGRERVWIVHRLDRETSGLMVFARTEEAKRTLQDGWADLDKRYLAITERAPEQDEGELVSHLDESHPGKVFAAPPSEKTREARTLYHVIKRAPKFALVELRLKTGRRHQIRVQLANIGCPIIGDEKYGARVDPARRLGLHSCLLRLTHPVTGDEMKFESPLPPSLARLVA